jgi:GNAT superfamily N-acetyltransferase
LLYLCGVIRWVCVVNDTVVGFSIVVLVENNVWALFVQPEYEGTGIGKMLHKIMLDWYFENTDQTIWLGTDNNTRAQTFYTKQGWTAVGTHGKTEIKFEMTKAAYHLFKTKS